MRRPRGERRHAPQTGRFIRDFSRHRSRHVRGQGSSHRFPIGPARDRIGHAVDQPAASALVRAEPAGVVARDARCDRLRARRASGRLCRAARHRTVRADARRDARRSRGPGAAPGHPVERHARRHRMRRARGAGARIAHDHRQHGDARLHRAEADVAREVRAGGVPRGTQSAAAEGLRRVAPVRRVRVRHVGRVGHAVARLRAPRLVRPDARRHRTVARADAARRRRQRRRRAAARCAAARMGNRRTGRDRGRRRRQRGLGARHGRHRRGQRLPLARHVGCAVRRQRPLRAEPGRRRARVLPLRRRTLAPDERDRSCRPPRASTGSHARTARRPARWPRAPNAPIRPARRCSCRISAANARRTTTRTRAACSSAYRTSTAPTISHMR